MSYAYSSQFNSYVPAATGQVIGYVRDPKKYRINSYAQMVKTAKSVFVWYKLHKDDMGQRVVTDAEWVWADAAKRPEGHENSMRFDTVEAQTIRRAYDFAIGWEAIQQSDLKLLVLHTAMARNQRMTNFTKRAVALLENPSNWGGNTATANALNGGTGFWTTAVGSDPTSPYFLAIKKTLDAVAQKILLATNGAVDWSEEAPKLLLSPGLALAISETDEIHNYLRESPFAMDQIKGRVAGKNAQWGLPDSLYGFDLEIESAPKVTERPQAGGGFASTTAAVPTRSFIKSDNSAVVLSRVGGVDGTEGAPSFSTLQVYYKDYEVQVEVQDENWNRRTMGSVVEHCVEILAAPDSGHLITNVQN